MTAPLAAVLVGLLAALAMIRWLLPVIGDMGGRRGHSPWPWRIVVVRGSPVGPIVLPSPFLDVTDRDVPAKAGGSR